MADVTRFEDWRCVCDHEPYEHEDGFGCTAEGCDCMAQWELVTNG